MGRKAECALRNHEAPNPTKEIGEGKEDGTLKMVCYRPGDETGELVLGDKRKNEYCLPDLLTSMPNGLQGKCLQYWRLRQRNVCDKILDVTHCPSKNTDFCIIKIRLQMACPALHSPRKHMSSFYIAVTNIHDTNN